MVADQLSRTDVTFSCSEEEEPEEYQFPLTLKPKKSSGPQSPIDGMGVVLNGSAVI